MMGLLSSVADWLDSLFRWRRPPPPPPPPPPSPADAAALMLSLHNAERPRHGRAYLLSRNEALSRAARDHAIWMAEKMKLSHVGAGGSMPWDRAAAAGYKGRLIAENVAAGAGLSAEGAWRLWLSSAGHRANALDPDYRDVGFGVAVGGRDGQVYWCAVYGGGDY